MTVLSAAGVCMSTAGVWISTAGVWISTAGVCMSTAGVCMSTAGVCMSTAGVCMSISNDHRLASHHITVHKLESFGSSFNSCLKLTERTARKSNI